MSLPVGPRDTPARTALAPDAERSRVDEVSNRLPMDEAGSLDAKLKLDAGRAWRRGAKQRNRSPLSDFVSALRMAILAFGQGERGTARLLTPRQVAEIAPLLDGSLVRDEAAATRLLYVGDLSPASAVMDLLNCVMQWAERHPARSVDLRWAGSGDLQGVLRAQLLPPNLSQSFTSPAGVEELAALFQECGILAVPNLGQVDVLPMAQAMAAGLPILGSAYCPQVHTMMRPTETGWLFDSLSADGMARALDAALTTPQVRLAEMRAAVRRRVGELCAEPVGDGGHALWQASPPRFATSGQA